MRSTVAFAVQRNPVLFSDAKQSEAQQGIVMMVFER
jgi:hypothetical protein